MTIPSGAQTLHGRTRDNRSERIAMRNLITHSKSRLFFAPRRWAGGVDAVPVAQERDRTKIAGQVQMESDRSLSNRRRLAGGEGPDRGRAAEAGDVQGPAGELAATLADALQTMSSIDKELSRLYSYAMMLSDQDTRDSQHEGMKQEMVQLYAAVRRRRRRTSSRKSFVSRRARSRSSSRPSRG